MINLRYFCFVVIQLYLKVRALALFYFINLHHYTYITNRQNKIHRNSKFSSNPDVSQLISRDDTSIPSQHTPAQVNLTLISRDDTSIPSQHTPARINLTLISREYTHIPFAAYSRASQPHFNFPRIYFHPLAAYSRANQPHIIQRELYIMYSPRCRTPNKTITQNIISL